MPTVIKNIGFLFLVFLLFARCEEQDISNKIPTCFILGFDQSRTFVIGDTIEIAIQAHDRDGRVSHIALFINDELQHEFTTEPYTYAWETTTLSAGSYKIKAIATDDGGACYSDEKELTLLKLQLPVADFTVDRTHIDEGEEVFFTNLSTNNPALYVWNFGDGNTSNEINPAHLYEQHGLYTVTLSVSNAAGTDSKTRSDFITVSPDIIWDMPCPGNPTVTDVEGNVYNTVQIGEQCWMKENLRVTRYQVYNPMGMLIDGTELGELSESNTKRYYFLYNNNEALLETYGYLYNWYATLNTEDPEFEPEGKHQGICPDGWHIPDMEDWFELWSFMKAHTEADPDNWSDTGIGYYKLKEAGTEYWNAGNDGTNESGFTALPAGSRNIYGDYMNLGEKTSYWMATNNSTAKSYSFFLLLKDQYEYDCYDNIRKNEGVSIRCIKD